jgi:hypothetical protein
MPHAKFLSILRTLLDHDVEFIVVGGLALTLNGVPHNTLDVDVVHSRASSNGQRLLCALESLEAVFRIQPERRLKPDESHLAGPGRLNLMTRFGMLDVLGAIGRGLDFDALLPHSREMEAGAATRVRVLDLETLIAVKEELGSEKDRAVLPMLRRVLEEKRRQERGVR